MKASKFFKLAFKPIILLGLIGILSGLDARAQTDLGKKVDAAIDGAKRYFRETGTNLGRTDVPMVLFILQDHFKHDFGLEPIDRYLEADSELRDSYFQLYDKYYLDKSAPEFPDSLVYHFFETNDSPINVLTVRAMFCRKYPLPADFIDQLWAMERNGGYDLSHVPLQLVNAITNGCMSGNDERVQKLMASLELKLFNSINSDLVTDDYYFEAVVMLCYMNRCARVREKHMAKIIERQLEDGGWAYNSFEGLKSDPHASVLALWALLEYKQKHGLK